MSLPCQRDARRGEVHKRRHGRLAQYILCRGDKGDEPCGVCPSCVRMLDGTHPDVVRLLPEKDYEVHRLVDQVRELVALAGEEYLRGRSTHFIDRAGGENESAGAECAAEDP